MRRALPIALVSLVLPATALAVPVDETGKAQVAVTFAGFTYTPSDVVVDQGATLAFAGSFAAHPLAGNGEPGTPFPTAPISTGDSQSLTAMAAGTFRFYCTLHVASGMTGQVRVLAPATNEPQLRSVETSPAVGQQIDLDASASVAYHGIQTFEWDLNGDGAFEQPGPSTLPATFTAAGPITVGVRVTSRDNVVATASLPLTVVPAEPPSNAALPALSGIPAVGRRLTATAGTWTGRPVPTLARRWQRCDPSGTCVDIPGATGATYLPRRVDRGARLRVVVTATNAAGAAELASARTRAIVGVPHLVRRPRLVGVRQVGERLRCKTGTWTDRPTLTVKWTRGGRLIRNARGPRYRVRAADRGQLVACLVVARNVAGVATGASRAVMIA